jgi:hypothetical protein
MNAPTKPPVRNRRRCVVAHADACRVEARQQRRMSRRGQRRLGRGVGKADALARQAIEHRRGRLDVPVRANPVGADGVEGDQQDIGRRGLRVGERPDGEGAGANP